MLDRKVGILEFDRSMLADLLQGRGPERSTTLASWLKSTSLTGRLTAIWALDWGSPGFLPNLIVGSDNAVIDLLAWSTVFLQGSGPVSGIIRVMTVDDLMGLSEQPRLRDLRVETLAPLIAVCIGEILARRGAAARVDLLTTEAVTSTLSYSLFRAQFIAPAIGRNEVVRRWKSVHGAYLEQKHDRITELILEMVDDALMALSPNDRSGEFQYHRAIDIAQFKSSANSRLRQSIPAATSRLFPDEFWEDSEKLSAEQLVDILDQMGPALERAAETSPSERALLFARLISRTNPDLDNQLELAKPMLEGLPEIGLWLAKAVAAQAPGKLLSANEGIGWKVAARLSSQFDPLALPISDLGWLEFELARQGADKAGRKRQAYGTVEIFPGHVVSRVPVEPASGIDQVQKPTRNRSTRSKTQVSDEPLAYAERNLEEALYTIQNLRRRRY